MESSIYNSYVEIDLEALDDSYARVKAHVGEGVGLVPVLKSNAYGHGTVPMARYYALRHKVDLIAVSQLLEGLEIRQAGLNDVDVLIMGGLLERQLPAAVAHDLQFSLFDINIARLLSREAAKQGRIAKVQVKIETGHGRIGVKPGATLEALLDEVKALGNIEITGFFTHFSKAETPDEPYTLLQFDRFKQALAQADQRGLTLRYRHCCNTLATMWFREGFLSHVRAGSVIMGYPCMDDYSNPLGVREPLSWRAHITHIHELEPGESCGYGRHYMAEKPTRVAVINVGYGDGLFRPLVRDGGPIIVNDTRTRFLAACMDMSMVDVTGIDCAVGDEVTIFGRSRGGAMLTLNEYASLTGQPTTYSMVMINHRVERRYING